MRADQIDQIRSSLKEEFKNFKEFFSSS